MKQRTPLFIAGLAALVSLTACSGARGPEQQSSSKWLPSGQIVLSRGLPQISAPDSMSMLGFIPVIGGHSGVWLSLDLQSKQLSLMEGNRVVAKSPFEGGATLAQGSYQVLHMQKAPLWYAPDSYFAARNIPTPSEGDKARFRRGALGDFAIFINKETPIHSGPVWSDDVGGIRVDSRELAKIYRQLQVGSIIDVR